MHVLEPGHTGRHVVVSPVTPPTTACFGQVQPPPVQVFMHGVPPAQFWVHAPPSQEKLHTDPAAHVCLHLPALHPKLH